MSIIKTPIGSQHNETWAIVLFHLQYVGHISCVVGYSGCVVGCSGWAWWLCGRVQWLGMVVVW